MQWEQIRTREKERASSPDRSERLFLWPIRKPTPCPQGLLALSWDQPSTEEIQGLVPIEPSGRQEGDSDGSAQRPAAMRRGGVVNREG